MWCAAVCWDDSLLSVGGAGSELPSLSADCAGV